MSKWINVQGKYPQKKTEEKCLQWRNTNWRKVSAIEKYCRKCPEQINVIGKVPYPQWMNVTENGPKLKKLPEMSKMNKLIGKVSKINKWCRKSAHKEGVLRRSVHNEKMLPRLVSTTKKYCRIMLTNECYRNCSQGINLAGKVSAMNTVNVAGKSPALSECCRKKVHQDLTLQYKCPQWINVGGKGSAIN